MAKIADMSEQVNRMTGGNSGAPEYPWFYLDPRVGGSPASSPIAGRWNSLWQYIKHPGGPGAAPGATPRNPTNATDGSFFHTNPGGGRQKWLHGGWASVSVPGALLLCDRLGDVSGFSGANSSTQSVSGGSLSVSRYTGTGAVGNQIGVEIYVNVGTTPTTIFATYTNEQGTGSRTTDTVTFGGTNFREAQRFILLPLQSGDKGVRSVESVKLAASTGSAGDFGITIYHSLIIFPVGAAAIPASIPLSVEPPGHVEVKTGACFSFLWFPNTTTAPMVNGQLGMFER